MIVEIDSVELNFDHKKILYGVYLRFETGKITGILGRNGCGKTSLIRILFGDLKPKYKNIRLNNRHHKKPFFKTSLIGYLPQHQLFHSNLKINRAFKLFQVDWVNFTTIFDAFKKYERSKINELSSGELRVVETYLILNSRKKIILLDEPFSFIAPIYVEKFKKLISERKKDTAILITDHFYRDVLEISDSVYLLKNGYSKPIKSKEDLKNEGYICIE